MMNIIPFFIISVSAIFLGQIVSHLNKKLPPVVEEKISYKEFFESLKSDFKIDYKYSIIFIIIFNLLMYFVGNNVTTYLYSIIVFALAIVCSIDIRFRLIPDEVHVIILIVGIINFILNINMWWNFILGAAIGGGIFYGLGLLSILIFKKEGMGFGDVKLMAALGFMFGIKSILVITLVSFVFGAIIGGALLIIKNKESDGYIPFGPFIALGAVIVMFISPDHIIDLYITFCSFIGLKMSDVVYWIMEKFS